MKPIGPKFSPMALELTRFLILWGCDQSSPVVEVAHKETNPHSSLNTLSILLSLLTTALALRMATQDLVRRSGADVEGQVNHDRLITAMEVDEKDQKPLRSKRVASLDIFRGLTVAVSALSSLKFQ